MKINEKFEGNNKIYLKYKYSILSKKLILIMYDI